MAEIDSLDIQIEASAKKASDSIDKLIGKLGKLSSSLKIDTSGLEKIANIKGLDNISKSAKNVENQLKTIVNSAGEVLSSVNSSSKSASKSMESIGNTAKRVSKSLSQITEKYKDLGKGYTIKGNATQIQKEIDKISNAYEKAKLKKDDLEASGKVNNKQYENAVKDTIKWSNAIESLKNQLDSLNNQAIMPKFSPEFEAKIAAESKSVEQAGEGLSKFTKRLSDFKKDIESVGKGTDLSNIARGLEISLQSLKSDFPTATKEISDYENTITRLKETMSEIPSMKVGNVSFEKIEKQTINVEEKIKELKQQFKDAGKGFYFEGNSEQLEIEIKKLNVDLGKLYEKRDKKIDLGEIDTKPFRDIMYEIQSITNKLDILESSRPEALNRTLEENVQKARQLREQLTQLKIPTINEGNITKLQNELQNAKDKMSSLKVELENKLTMGKITASVDDSGYVALREQIALTGKTIDALQEKIKEASKQTKISNAEMLVAFEENLKKLQLPTIQENNLTKLQNELKKTEANLEKLQLKLANGLKMGTITESIDDSGYKKLREQIVLTEKQAEKLKERIKELQNQSKKINVFDALSKGIKNVSASFLKLFNSSGKLKKSLNGVQSGFKGLLRSILPILGIRQLFNLGKESIESSMGAIETLNYFNAAFGQVAQKADLSSFQKLGYDSAEKYANSFSERAKELTEKMTGFSIKENGLMKSANVSSLGINLNDVMNYQAMFGQMSSSMGVASETALKLSKVLTEIGADLASVRNMDFEKVWQDMASGLTGMSRTLDKYGANIRNTNMQQKLSELGIKANISALNQNDKALLRTIILLDSTRYAWGDLSKTINQPANQLRLLQANFTNLARAIGNIFLPIVAKVLPYINMLVQALTRLAEWIVKLLGFEGFDWGGASGAVGLDMSGLIDQTEEAAGALNGATKEAKKLKNQLQGFDELNVITTQDDTPGAGAEGAGTATTGALESALDKVLDEYQKAWDKAFSEMEKRANTFADNVSKAFKEGGIYGVGEYIGSELTKAMNQIPWDNIYKGARGFGTGLAQFLNGLISPELFGALGKTIASSLNTALYFLNSFGKTFDWENFGLSIATGINEFFKTFDFKTAADTINIWLKGVLTTAATLLKETDFEQIGNKIGVFLKELDFTDILSDVATVIWEAIKDAFDLLKGMFEEAPLETSLIAAFGILKFTGLGAFIAGKIKDAIVTNILGAEAGTSIATALGTNISTALASMGGIGGLLTADIGTVLGTGTAAQVGLTLGATILGGVAAAIIGWNIGQKLYEKFQEPIDSAVTAVGDFVTKTLPNAFKNAWDGIKKVWSPIYNWFNKNFLTPIKTGFNTALTFIKDIWSKVSDWFKTNVITPITNNFNYFKDGISTIFSGLWTVISAIWIKVSGWFNTNVINPVKNAFSTLGTNISNAISTAWTVISAIWKGVSGWFEKNVTTPVGNVFKLLGKAISGAFDTALSGLEKAWKKVSGWFEKNVTDPIKSVFKTFVNAIINGFNWILKKVGADTLPQWSGETPAYANGTSGLPKDTVGVVNDQKGSTYRELILPPDGKPFIPKGRNVMLHLKKGTKIMPAEQTKEFVSKMKNMPHFAGGVGDFFSGLFGNIKSFTGDILDYLEKPKDILKIAFSKFVNPSGWVGVFKDIAGGALKTITNSATDYIKKIFDEGINIKYDPTKGVSQWKGLASKALKLTKQYSDLNLTYLLNQMQHESGGNPNAINNWDINAKLGHPSKGLMQVIDSTFKSYALSPYNKNIYDPLSNMIASIRYTVSRYGSLYAGWAARGYKGYYSGGFPDKASLFWAGEYGVPEMVGTVGGKPAVASGSEITGIRDAINSTSAEEIMLMREQNQLLRQLLQKETGITYKDAFEAVRRGDAEYKMINGQSAFLY